MASARRWRALHATGLEAERERAAHLSTGPDTGPLLRTIQRLRHDVVMIGRASVVPLPANVQARLARPLSDVSNAIVGYMRAAAASLRDGGGAADIQPVDAALQAYAAEVAALRSEGLIRGVPVDVAERFLRAGILAGADAAEPERSRPLPSEWCESAG